MLLIASPQVAFRLKLLHDGLPNGALSPSLTVLAFCVFSLLGWRLWKFTIRPYMRPQAPKELPYWIPCESIIGSGLDFVLMNSTQP